MKIKVTTKCDWASHLLPLNDRDKESIETIVTNGGFPEPDMKLSIYKNRRGKYKGVYLWCKVNLGVCRVEPLFATRWDYNYVDMEDVKITLC